LFQCAISQAVAGSMGNWGVVFARVVTGGVGVNGLRGIGIIENFCFFSVSCGITPFIPNFPSTSKDKIII